MMQVHVTPLGHASVMIEIGGLVLLFDPVFEERVGMNWGRFVLGAKRLQPPPLRAKDLHTVHAVLLSHAHWDHTDKRTLLQMPPEAIAIVHRNNRDLVRMFRDRRSLRWHESTWLDVASSLPRVKVTAIPSKHWGARMLIDLWRGWGGFLLEVPDIPSFHDASRPFSIVFAGDTAHTDVYAKLCEQRGCGVDLAIMPIGSYNPWIFNHCSPEQAWQMGIHDLQAKHLMPIHYATFRLSNEPSHEPLERLFKIAQRENAHDRLIGLSLGVPHSLLD